MYKLKCFFFYKWCFPAVQVCDKNVPVELLLRDASLTDLYIRSKLERQSSHSLLRSLVTALERTFVDPISRGFLPLDVHVEALDSLDHQRVTLGNGRIVLVNTDTDDVSYVLPLDFDIKSIFMACTYRNHYLNGNPNCFQLKKIIKIQWT